MTPALHAIQEARLYGILDLSYVTEDQALSVTEQMLKGGVQVLQLRAKKSPPEIIVRLGSEMAGICRGHGVPFILNDYPALVAETKADGVHVGQDDLSVAETRQIIGAQAILGKSSHSLAQAQATAREDVTYLGFGPLFATPTKPDYQPIGVEDIQTVYSQVAKPIFCIGGIKKENLPEVLSAGARRVVIVSGILQAADIAAYCEACRDSLDGTN